MVTRRMIYSLGVTYSTSVDQMKAIPGWVEQIIEATQPAQPLPFHELAIRA